MASSVDMKVPALEPAQRGQPPEKKVAIVTGASQGIGAGITVGCFRAAGYAVVGTALSVEPSDTPDVLVVPGHIVQAETAELVVQQGLARFARIDTLVTLGRVGEISDVVGGILYLEQATFVTGETLHIDGGRAAGD
jgi:NAD(P)-dependent dehydrogenase (short-subunit alcohol dehydrogenase family)